MAKGRTKTNCIVLALLLRTHMSITQEDREADGGSGRIGGWTHEAFLLTYSHAISLLRFSANTAVGLFLILYLVSSFSYKTNIVLLTAL